MGMRTASIGVSRETYRRNLPVLIAAYDACADEAAVRSNSLPEPTQRMSTGRRR